MGNHLRRPEGLKLTYYTHEEGKTVSIYQHNVGGTPADFGQSEQKPPNAPDYAALLIKTYSITCS